MFNRSKYRLLLVIVTLLSLGLGLIHAQETLPGEGGIIVWGNQRGSSNLDPITPLRCSGVDCSDVYSLIYPDFLGLDPATLSLQPNVPGSMVTDWEISEDGMTYTFTVRDDLFWSDGVPVSVTDVFFMFEAMNKVDVTEVSSSLGPAKANIASMEIVDDSTIAITMTSANCQALSNIALISPLPAHAYGYVLGEDFDWTSIIGHEFDFSPDISAGPFMLSRIEPGTAVYLAHNPDYSDPTDTAGVLPQGIVYLDVPDYNIMAERLVAGQDNDVNYMHEPDTEVVPLLEDSDVQLFGAPGTLWHYVSLNLADPNQAADGLDENGDVIEQAPHPILGDKRVRQALQHAINIEEIINGPLSGNGSAMVSGTGATAFTYNTDLVRRPFDLDAARALLDEAGFVASGDPLVDGGDGLRIATDDALYAEPVTEFVIGMINPGDVRNDVAVLLQAQFAQIGVRVDVQPMDFNAMYDDNLGVQIYDTAVAGWRESIPFTPDQRNFFGAQNDIVSSESPGFNFGSWYDEEFEELSEFIANAPGCNEDDIIEAAWRVQEIMWEEQPYLWLYSFNSFYAATKAVDGFDPFPAQGNWNMDAWRVSSRQ